MSIKRTLSINRGISILYTAYVYLVKPVYKNPVYIYMVNPVYKNQVQIYLVNPVYQNPVQIYLVNPVELDRYIW